MLEFLVQGFFLEACAVRVKTHQLCAMVLNRHLLSAETVFRLAAI